MLSFVAEYGSAEGGEADECRQGLLGSTRLKAASAVPGDTEMTGYTNLIERFQPL